MGQKLGLIGILMAAIAILLLPNVWAAADTEQKVQKNCMKCHQNFGKMKNTLVDSRPAAGYMKGHIPTAISIPFPKMTEMMDKLPKEKDQLVIFYCQGYR